MMQYFCVSFLHKSYCTIFWQVKICQYTSIQGVIFFFFQAMLHASVVCQRRLVVDWVSASDLDKETAHEVSQVSVLF